MAADDEATPFKTSWVGIFALPDSAIGFPLLGSIMLGFFRNPQGFPRFQFRQAH